MDSVPLADNDHCSASSLLPSLHHTAHYTGTVLRIPPDTASREVAIEGYSASMVELAKRALLAGLALRRGGAGGGGPPVVQQPAIASTSADSGSAAAVSSQMNNRVSQYVSNL